MQWADFKVTELFGNHLYNPVLPSERQFTLNNTNKKREFQDKLLGLVEEKNKPESGRPSEGL